MDVHSIPPASLHTYKIPSDLEISLGMKQCMHFICIRTSCVATAKGRHNTKVCVFGVLRLQDYYWVRWHTTLLEHHIVMTTKGSVKGYICTCTLEGERWQNKSLSLDLQDLFVDHHISTVSCSLFLPSLEFYLSPLLPI